MKLTQKEFIDLCILCGCDYTNTIGGIGPVKAYKFIQDFGTIEEVLKHVEWEVAHQNSGKKARFIIPEEFAFDEARKLFTGNEYPDTLTEVTE